MAPSPCPKKLPIAISTRMRTWAIISSCRKARRGRLRALTPACRGILFWTQPAKPARYTRGEKAGQVKLMAPNVWLDSHQVVESLTWAPGFPQIVKNARFSDGGWVEAQGCTVLNLYRPPTINILHANVQRVGLYLEHWHWLYPEDANHILTWQACRVQHPEIKINHCLLLGGAPGIGKDSALEPLRQAVGPGISRKCRRPTFSEVGPISADRSFAV
jgi:hypothetical protein